MNLEVALKKASNILKSKNIHSHALDAQVILSDLMGVEREYLIANDEKNIPKKIIKKYISAIKRRKNREPVAYILGKKEFWSYDFLVNNNTLVPRAETELLIYKIINFYRNKKIKILDIGTGSGCILLTILRELPLSKGVGIDISSGAIDIAKLNSKNLNLNNRSSFKISDIDKFNDVEKYDLIVSNPPYIPTANIKNLSKDITKYEPLIALDGGIDGLDLIKKIIYKSKNLLKKSGLLAFEIGYNQYPKVSRILNENKFKEMGKESDYKQNVRCIISTKLD